MDATRSAAAARVSKFTPVEKGVTGKEKTFQQNRNFGPGAMKPYPYSKPPPETRPIDPHNRVRPLQKTAVGNGVYYGSPKRAQRT